MTDSRFVAYVGPADLHDGQVQEVRQDGTTLTVRVAGGTGLAVWLEFTGVSEVKAVEPVGMMLYALCEMSAPSPSRRFVFANWAEDDSATLEIIAEEFQTEG